MQSVNGQRREREQSIDIDGTQITCDLEAVWVAGFPNRNYSTGNQTPQHPVQPARTSMNLFAPGAESWCQRGCQRTWTCPKLICLLYIYIISICLVGGLESFLLFHVLGIIFPTDELIFFRGVGIPPTRYTIFYFCDNSNTT